MIFSVTWQMQKSVWNGFWNEALPACCFALCVRRACACTHVDVWYYVRSHNATPSCQRDLRHLIVTEYLPSTYSHFCHTPEFFWLESCASTVMQRGDTEGCIPGSYVTWAGLWWTWFYYTAPVSQFRGGGWERVKTHTERRSPTARQTDEYSLQSITTHRTAQMMQDLSRGLQGGTGWRRT